MSPTTDDLRRLHDLATDDDAGQRLAQVRRRIHRVQRRRRIGAAVGASAAVAATVVVALVVTRPDTAPSELEMTPAQSPQVTAAPTASAPTVNVTTPPATAPATQATAPAAATPLCTTSQLRLTLGAPSGAAGSAYYPLQLRNVGSAACELLGYPGVSFLGADRQQLGPAAERQPSDSTTKVVLAPGGYAHATLRLVNSHNYPDTTCGPATSAYLRVFPPDNTDAIELAQQLDVCTRLSTATVTVMSAGRQAP